LLLVNTIDQLESHVGKRVQRFLSLFGQVFASDFLVRVKKKGKIVKKKITLKILTNLTFFSLHPLPSVGCKLVNALSREKTFNGSIPCQIRLYGWSIYLSKRCPKHILNKKKPLNTSGVDIYFFGLWQA